MHNTAHIIPSFSVIYSTPKRSDIKRCVSIGVHIVSAVVALKVLVGSFSNMFTSAARLTRITRVNNHNLHTIKQSLVFNILPKHRETPFTKFSPKLLVSSFARKSNFSKVFNSDSLTFLFSRLNNRFCDGVINYGSVSLFIARKPFQKFTRTSCAFALNRTPNLLPMLTVCVKPISRMLNAIRSGYNRVYTKIATDKLFYILDIFFGNVNGLEKVKLAFLVNQIRLPFNVRNVSGIMANKFNLLSTPNAPQRNHVVRLVGHYPTVIGNASKRLKGAFGFLVQLISISNLSNLPYKHLGRKLKRSLVGMVNFVMEFEVIKNLFLPSYIRNSIANSISFLHCFEKQVSLFISRQKFNFQCQLHSANILNNFIYKKIITNFVKQFNYGAAIPSIGSKADQWVSLPKSL